MQINGGHSKLAAANIYCAIVFRINHGKGKRRAKKSEACFPFATLDYGKARQPSPLLHSYKNRTIRYKNANQFSSLKCESRIKWALIHHHYALKNQHITTLVCTMLTTRNRNICNFLHYANYIERLKNDAIQLGETNRSRVTCFA